MIISLLTITITIAITITTTITIAITITMAIMIMKNVTAELTPLCLKNSVTRMPKRLLSTLIISLLTIIIITITITIKIRITITIMIYLNTMNITAELMWSCI